MEGEDECHPLSYFPVLPDTNREEGAFREQEQKENGHNTTSAIESHSVTRTNGDVGVSNHVNCEIIQRGHN